MRHVLLYILACGVAGCSIITSPGSYEGGEGDASGEPDVFDGGPDLSEPDARSACITPCEGAEPYCDEGTARCVQCLDSTHCSDGGECMDGRCPECEVDSDCTLPEAPVCSRSGDTTGQCVPCERNSDCDDITASAVALTVCDQQSGEPGVCVQCNGAEDACGAFVCDVRARECTEIDPESGPSCTTCVSSAQCRGGNICAEEMFAGAPTGFYCFPRAAMGCPSATLLRGSDTWTSVEGERIDVCHPIATTCRGLLDDNGSCANDDACGLPGVDDASCEMTGLCTYLCSNDDDCMGTDVCPLGMPRICVVP